jgi:VanZ family protein
MLALRYRPFWITASCVLVAIVVWGSLQTSINPNVGQGFDKVEHFAAYLFLAVWFTGLYRRPRYAAVATGLLALGFAMEVGQFAMHAGRTGDPYDMAANGAGIVAGVLLAWFATGGWAERVEAWLAR